MTITHGDTSVLEMVATLEQYRRKRAATVTIDNALIGLHKKILKPFLYALKPMESMYIDVWVLKNAS